MELTLIYTIVGFGLAGWSVIGNDSIQTLGTFIASKQKWFKWYTLAASASFVMILALGWGWYAYDGDISYGRLTRIPYQEIQWYHAVAPGILLLLTRIGIPVSTTFLVLSAFASTVVLEKMLMKSVVGYGLAAVVAYIAWIIVSKFINEKFDEVSDKWIGFWRNSVWVTSGWLWWVWLSHDVANIAVYLPRQLSPTLLITVIRRVGLNCLGKYTAILATSCDNQTHHNQPEVNQTELRQKPIHLSLTSSNFSLINFDTIIQAI